MSINSHSGISEAVRILTAARDEQWDAEEGMGVTYVLTSPLGRAAKAIHESDPIALRWICFFVARRALACWDLSCEDSKPREVVAQIGSYLLLSEGDLSESCLAIQSPHQDCRYSDTQGAVDAITHAARYINNETVLDAVYSISSADLAYNHVLTEDEFRTWLLKVAMPVGAEHREMTFLERNEYRNSRFGLAATLREPIIGEQDTGGNR